VGTLNAQELFAEIWLLAVTGQVGSLHHKVLFFPSLLDTTGLSPSL
jgi:hypothetical protein